MAIPQRETYYISRVEAILENILGANNDIVPPESLIEELLQCWLYGNPFTDTVITDARNVKALIAIVNGETYDEEPTSEIEALLKAIANDDDPDPAFLPPKSRNGKLLLEIAETRNVPILTSADDWSRYTISAESGIRIGTTSSYYQSSTTRIVSATLEKINNGMPGVENVEIRSISLEAADGFHFGVRGYNDDVSNQTTLVPLGSNTGERQVVDVSEYRYINVLFSLKNNGNIGTSDFDKITVVANPTN